MIKRALESELTSGVFSPRGWLINKSGFHSLSIKFHNCVAPKAVNFESVASVLALSFQSVVNLTLAEKDTTLLIDMGVCRTTESNFQTGRRCRMAVELSTKLHKSGRSSPFGLRLHFRYREGVIPLGPWEKGVWQLWKQNESTFIYTLNARCM